VLSPALGLGQVLHDRLHWLDVPDRVLFKLAVTVHQRLNGRAPPYLSEHCIPVSSAYTRRHLICVPPTITYLLYLVSGSTLTAVWRFQLLARWPGTHSRILSEIQRAAQTVLGVYLKRTRSRLTSTSTPMLLRHAGGQGAPTTSESVHLIAESTTWARPDPTGRQPGVDADSVMLTAELKRLNTDLLSLKPSFLSIFTTQNEQRSHIQANLQLVYPDRGIIWGICSRNPRIRLINASADFVRSGSVGSGRVRLVEFSH